MPGSASRSAGCKMRMASSVPTMRLTREFPISGHASASPVSPRPPGESVARPARQALGSANGCADLARDRNASRRRERVAVAVDGHARPDHLCDPEWPGTGEEAVCAGEQAAAGEAQCVATVAPLQRAHRHHEGHCRSAEGGRHASEFDVWRRLKHSYAYECQSGSDARPAIEQNSPSDLPLYLLK